MDDLKRQLDAALAAYEAAGHDFWRADDMLAKQLKAPGGPTDAQIKAWETASERLEQARDELRKAAAALPASQGAQIAPR